MSSDLNDKAVCSAREEVQESRVRIESLSYQLSALQKQVQVFFFYIDSSVHTCNFRLIRVKGCRFAQSLDLMNDP